jgi:hypothetical protein
LTSDAKKANEQDLGSLHGLLAKIMKQEIKDPEKRTPALLNAVRQFLKDNNITCIGEENDVLQDIKELLPVFSADDEMLV